MDTGQAGAVLPGLFRELVDGSGTSPSPFMLNSGDAGLLRSIDQLTAADASRSVEGGATIAAHTEHLRLGLLLMNRWAAEGGNPFAVSTWDEAWNISAVDAPQWEDIRRGLREQCARWVQILEAPRQFGAFELNTMIGSIAHLAYHVGAIRQISKAARGPRGGTFSRILYD